MLGRQRTQAARKGMLVDRPAARAAAQSVIEDFDVRTSSPDLSVRALSGGNQQKVVVGRALLDEPGILLAYQPTRGIDVGAAALVQSRIIQARNNGAAVVLISFELDELLALSDRVLVMYRGRVAAAFERAQFDRGRIGEIMAGASA